MKEAEEKNRIFICPYCGQPTQIIWVHGHGQCKICKTNIDECCRGEQMNDEKKHNNKNHKHEKQ